MDDEVGAELERLLQVGRGEGVVDREQRAGLVGCLRRGGDVDHAEQGVRGRLDPDEADVVVEIVGKARVELLGRDVAEAVALGLVDLGGHAVDAAVDVPDQHDAVARIEQVHDRRRRREAGGEGDAVACALEARERDLERGASRVRGARVVVALVLADRLLHVGRGLVDGRDHRSGHRIGLLPDMDRTGLELHRPEA